MTKSAQQQYKELLALCQIHLSQEFPSNCWIPIDPATYATFKRSAPPKPAEEKKAPIPVPTQINPLPLPSPVKTATHTPPPPVKEAPPEKITAPAPQKVSAKVVVEEKRIPTTPSSQLTLDPVKTLTTVDLSDIRKIIAEKFPQQQILDAIPSDEEARRVHSAWKLAATVPAVVVLSFNESSNEKAFLQKMTSAIEQKLAPAAVISAQGIEDWDHFLKSKGLRLIIASTHGLEAVPEAMKHYREFPKQARSQLGKVALCPLPDISLYLREPQLKHALWSAICELLK